MFNTHWALSVPGVFQPQVQSHLLQTWFLHTGLEQLPTVYGCYKGHNLTAPEWEKKSRCTESDQGQPTVQYLLSKPTAKRHTKPVSTSGSRSGKYVAGQTHSCNLTEAMTKAKGLGLNTAPEWKGNPDETSHSSFHYSLTQGYMAAPYLRWLEHWQPNELLEDGVLEALTPPILQIPTAPLYWWRHIFQWQQQQSKFWYPYFIVTNSQQHFFEKLPHFSNCGVLAKL